jgi:hypothetical protein
MLKNAEATVYQMIWRSKRGSALIQVEKPSMSTQMTSMRTRRTFGGPKKRKLIRGQDQELQEIMLPKAIDYFHQNAEAMVYQMIWKSKHGLAHIQVEKPCMSTRRSSMRTQRTFGVASKRKQLPGHDEELIRNRIRGCHFLNLWVTHVPIQLQRSLKNWVRKEKEILSAAPQLRLKF